MPTVHPITVVNRHHPDATGDYIGRGSALGNIFVLTEDLGLETALNRYRWWLAGELADAKSQAAIEVARFARTALAAPVNLMCSCAPRRCHGDYVREAIYAKLGIEALLVLRSSPRPKVADQLGLFAAPTAASIEHAAFVTLFESLAAAVPDKPIMTKLVHYRKFLLTIGLPAATPEGTLTHEASDPATMTQFLASLRAAEKTSIPRNR